MPLQYYLADNVLTADPNDYAAKPTNVRSYTLDEIIKRISNKGMTLTEVDISAVLKAYHAEIGEIIADGNAVNTPLFNAQPSVSGVFNSPLDEFDNTRHRINTNLSNGTVIRNATAQISVQKVSPPASGTQITAVMDKTTNTTNDQLTANAPIEIVGKKIKITPDADAGVFFVASDGTATPAAMLVTNNPSNLVVMTPALSSGSYFLEVRTYFSGGGNSLKTIRIERFFKVLTVV